MILKHLMEKKDLIIYIDLRIKQLKELKKRLMKEAIDNKWKEPIRKKYNARILELKRLKRLIKENKIKENSKWLWKKYGKQSGFVQFPKTKKMDTLDALQIPKLAEGGIVTNPSAIGIIDGCFPLTDEQWKKLSKETSENIVGGYSKLTEEQWKKLSEDINNIWGEKRK